MLLEAREPAQTQEKADWVINQMDAMVKASGHPHITAALRCDGKPICLCW